MSINIEALRDGMVKWITNYEWHQMWTLNFNRRVRITTAQEKLGEFFQRIDRQRLGPKYRKKRDQRIVAMAIPEHVYSNVHYHCLVEVADAVTISDMGEVVQACWRPAVVSGTSDVKGIYDLEGLARYLVKEMRRPDDFGRIIWSEDFWPPDAAGHRAGRRSELVQLPRETLFRH